MVLQLTSKCFPLKRMIKSYPYSSFSNSLSKPFQFQMKLIFYLNQFSCYCFEFYLIDLLLGRHNIQEEINVIGVIRLLRDIIVKCMGDAFVVSFFFSLSFCIVYLALNVTLPSTLNIQFPLPFYHYYIPLHILSFQNAKQDSSFKKMRNPFSPTIRNSLGKQTTRNSVNRLERIGTGNYDVNMPVRIGTANYDVNRLKRIGTLKDIELSIDPRQDSFVKRRIHYL